VSFLDRVDSPEGDERLAPGLVCRHAAANVLRGLHLQMELDLVVQIPLGGFPLKERLPPARDRLEQFHQPVPNTHSTADT
jgi:hypothetical protein